MGIKRKKAGPAPIPSERWKELATDINRMDEARAEYRRVHPEATLIQAHRACAEHLRKHRERYHSR